MNGCAPRILCRIDCGAVPGFVSAVMPKEQFVSRILYIVNRLWYDGSRALRTFGFRQTVRYAVELARNVLGIYRSRNLASADFAMPGLVTVNFHGAQIDVPVTEIDLQTAPFDDTPIFGGLREMFMQDCYLRGFCSLPAGEPILDLGANRGLFGLIALSVLKASTVVAVEPRSAFTPISGELLAANGFAPDRIRRIEAFAVPAGGNGVSMAELSALAPAGRYGLCKMDIEGGEFPLVSEGALLQMCDMVSAEVHPREGDVELLVHQMTQAGFTVHVADRFGCQCRIPDAEYLYAAREGSRLRAPKYRFRDRVRHRARSVIRAAHAF